LLSVLRPNFENNTGLVSAALGDRRVSIAVTEKVFRGS